MSEEAPVNPMQEEREAWSRVALTHDGLLIHRHLRRVLESRRTTDSCGALSRHEGARILAGDLMDAMSKGIESNRGRSDADRPILARSSGPKPVARASGIGRRVELTPGDGWSPEPDADGAGAT